MYAIVFIVAVCFTGLAHFTDIQPKPTYVCPPNFIRLSHRCYFFSRNKATWNDAYFQCQSMHSSLAIVKNVKQDRLIRKTLSRKTLKPLERWLGARFDWNQNQWKWAASGKPVLFNGFDPSVNQTANWAWNCLALDPKLDYRWNSRSCLEEKHFICHKKIQIVRTNKSRKSLMKKYNMKPLNEIPIPELQNSLNASDVKELQKILPARSVANMFTVEVNKNFKPSIRNEYKKKARKDKKKKTRRPVPILKQFPNGTVYENDGKETNRRRRNKAKDEIPENPMEIYYQTYHESSHSNDPFHPKPIVEEYNFMKS